MNDDFIFYTMFAIIVGVPIVVLIIIITVKQDRDTTNDIKWRALRLFNDFEIGDTLAIVEQYLGQGIKEREQLLDNGEIESVYSWYYGTFAAGYTSGMGMGIGTSGQGNNMFVGGGTHSQYARITMVFKNDKLVAKEQIGLDKPVC